MMRTLLGSTLLVLLVSSLSYSQPETVTATYKYNLGDNDTRNDARRIASLEAQKLCIQKVGIYVQGQMSRKTDETIATNGKSEFTDVTNQEFKSFIGALVRVEILDEKFSYSGDTQTLTTTVRASVDTREIAEKLRRIKDDDSLRIKVISQQEELTKLEDQLLKLQKSIKNTPPEKVYPLREQRAQIFKEIDEVEAVRFEVKRITKMAVSNIDLGMNESDVVRVSGQPRSKGSCGQDEYWNYGSVWIVFSSGVVAAIVPIKNWPGPCSSLASYHDVSIK